MVRVAFLERRPWIAARESLRERGRERNVGACQRAQAILWTMRGVPHVPSRAGAERYADPDRPHAGDIETVRIRFRHEHRVAGTNEWRLGTAYSAHARERGPPIEQLVGVETLILPNQPVSRTARLSHNPTSNRKESISVFKRN